MVSQNIFLKYLWDIELMQISVLGELQEYRVRF